MEKYFTANVIGPNGVFLPGLLGLAMNGFDGSSGFESRSCKASLTVINFIVIGVSLLDPGLRSHKGSMQLSVTITFYYACHNS